MELLNKTGYNKFIGPIPDVPGRTWANNSLISYQLTPGGHRRFDITSVCHAQQPADRTSNYVRHPLPDPEQEASTGVIYYRVSSSKQPLTFSEFRIQDADATS